MKVYTSINLMCPTEGWQRAQMYHAILAGAGDFVMPDMMRIGGVRGWLRADAEASLQP